MQERNYITATTGIYNKEGDVRCIRHIINLAVQAALTSLKAVPADEPNAYRLEYGAARVPSLPENELVAVLSKLRRHIYVFCNRRQWKNALKRQCEAANIEFKRPWSPPFLGPWRDRASRRSCPLPVLRISFCSSIGYSLVFYFAVQTFHAGNPLRLLERVYFDSAFGKYSLELLVNIVQNLIVDFKSLYKPFV
jgi:hypothetical protein